MSRNGPERRSGTWYLAGTSVPVGYLLLNQPERFVLSVPTLICIQAKKVIQYFVEEDTRNFREIIKKGSFRNFS